MLKTKNKSLLFIICAVIFAIFSITVLSKLSTSLEVHKSTIASLDEKRTTVMELTAAATTASVAITTIPGDTATPIADKLADISGYFIIVLCAIYLEKYLLVVSGYATFTFIIPIACAIFIANQFLKNNSLNYLVKKLAIFGFAIVMVVPVSVHVTDIIEDTFDTSIAETIDTAKSLTEENNIDESTTEESGETMESEGSAGNDSWTSWFNNVWENLTDTAKEKATDIKNTVVDTVSDAVIVAKTILNGFIEALALMLVTTCIIPILILIFFLWLIKTMVGVDIHFPGMPGPFGPSGSKEA